MNKSNRFVLSVAAAASALALGVSAQAQTYSQPAPHQNFRVGEVPSNNLQTGPQLDGSRADAAKTAGRGQIVDQHRASSPRQADNYVSNYGNPRSRTQQGYQLDGSRVDGARAAPHSDPNAPHRM